MRDLEINGLTGEEETRRQYEYIEKARQYVAQKEKEAGRKLTCCVHTFGCQMNARDSEKLLGILTDIGYVETEDEHADFVIYNTCTVRENANNKVYGRLGYLSNFKKKNPHMMIALCGCMMQEPTVVEKIRKSYRFVDLVFGTHNIYKFAELLCNRMWFLELTIFLSWQSFYMNAFLEEREYLMSGRRQTRLLRTCQVTVSLDLRLA